MGAAIDSSQPPSSHQSKSNQDNSLKTCKTEPKATQGYQLFWFLLGNGNRVNRLAASTSTTLHQFKFESGINGAPYGLPPFIPFRPELVTLALKRLSSFALDSCSLVTSLSGIKRKTSCYYPAINFEFVEIQFLTAGFAEKSSSHPLPKHLRTV